MGERRSRTSSQVIDGRHQKGGYVTVRDAEDIKRRTLGHLLLIASDTWTREEEEWTI